MDTDRSTIIFAGPNGSGKSTTRDPVLAGFKGQYINADDIAASLVKEIPDDLQRNIEAANRAEQMRLNCMRSGASFAFETVMSTPEKVAILSQAKNLGFSVEMIFVTTKDPSINIARVQTRVGKGGHAVSEDKIRSRYAETMRLLPSALGYVDRALIFDNSIDKVKPLLVAKKIGFGAPVEFVNVNLSLAWATQDLQLEMLARQSFYETMGRYLAGGDFVLPKWKMADASHGNSYSGEIVLCSGAFAVQRVSETNFVMHDLALTQQKIKQRGPQVVSYAYDKGKIISLDRSIER